MGFLLPNDFAKRELITTKNPKLQTQNHFLAMFSKISAWVLKTWGWKITGHYPFEIPKVVIAVAPHTSNWDFPVGVLTNSAMRCRANYVGKHTLFRWPFGYLFRYWGGIPVDRSTRHNFVAQVVEQFQKLERLHLVLAPEGTRKKVEKFKTGFYHIANGANVPICLCSFHWDIKEVFFDPELFWPSDDEQADLAKIWDHFKKVKGHTPENGVS